MLQTNPTGNELLLAKNWEFMVRGSELGSRFERKAQKYYKEEKQPLRIGFRLYVPN